VIVPPTGDGDADAFETDTSVEAVQPFVPVTTHVYVPLCKKVTELLVGFDTPEEGLHE